MANTCVFQQVVLLHSFGEAWKCRALRCCSSVVCVWSVGAADVTPPTGTERRRENRVRERRQAQNIGKVEREMFC